eukprot:gene3795-7543_t
MGTSSSTNTSIDFDENIYSSVIPEHIHFDNSLTLTFEDQTLHGACWLPKENPPKAIILLSHGLHEHSLIYFDFACELVNHNFGVFAIDHYAHGRSSGTRAFIDDYTKLVNGFLTLHNHVRSIYPSLPLFIFSHSMGTFVSLLCINKLPDIKAVIFSGTAIFSGPGSASPFEIKCLYPLSTTSLAIPITRAMAAIDPKGAAAPILESSLSSDLSQLEIRRKDPFYYHGDMMNKTAYSLLNMISECMTEIPKITAPFMCIHGSDDDVSLPKGAYYLYETSSTHLDSKVIKIHPGKHELLFEKEPVRTLARNDIIEYYENQFALIKQSP